MNPHRTTQRKHPKVLLSLRFVCLAFVVAILSLSIPASDASPDRCWTDKGVYVIGEYVTVWVEISPLPPTPSVPPPTYYSLRVHRPDGSVTVVELGALAPGQHAAPPVQAGAPAGERRVEVWGSNTKVTINNPVAVCYFVVAQPSPLQVTLTANPGRGEAPFAPSIKAEVCCGTPPDSWIWNFGDGTVIHLNPWSTQQGQNAPSHTYSTPATYTVSLTVTDSRGATGTGSVSIVVLPEATVTLTVTRTSTTTSTSVRDQPFVTAVTRTVTQGPVGPVGPVGPDLQTLTLVVLTTAVLAGGGAWLISAYTIGQERSLNRIKLGEPPEPKGGGGGGFPLDVHYHGGPDDDMKWKCLPLGPHHPSCQTHPAEVACATPVSIAAEVASKLGLATGPAGWLGWLAGQLEGILVDPWIGLATGFVCVHLAGYLPPSPPSAGGGQASLPGKPIPGLPGEEPFETKHPPPHTPG